MKHTIAIRPGVLEIPLPEALAALKGLGIENFEITAEAGTDFAATAQMTAAAGVNITSFSTGCTLDNPESLAALAGIIAGTVPNGSNIDTASVGTKVIFVSFGAGSLSYEQGIEVLRGLAEQAAAAGVVLSLETHVPFGNTGAIARQTIEAVGSKGLGYNYDSANIYYYNPVGIDGVEELKQALPYVASVHLKESEKGEPESFTFPAYGEGIVNFPEIFRLLDSREFAGPYTMELEGPVIGELTLAGKLAMIQACLDYLSGIGAR